MTRNDYEGRVAAKLPNRPRIIYMYVVQGNTFLFIVSGMMHFGFWVWTEC